jgi:cytochrome c-type biogenesis protein CcmF
MVAANSRLYGGLVVHVGVVLFALAFTMSSSFSTEREATLREGESTSLRGYTVTYLGTETQPSARKTTVSARLEITRGDRSLGVYEPALSRFANASQAIGTPSVRNSLREDVYLTLLSTPSDEQVVVGIRVNPMVAWLWIGAGVMVAGTAIAAWPSGRTLRRVQVTVPRAESAEPDVALVGAAASNPAVETAP